MISLFPQQRIWQLEERVNYLRYSPVITFIVCFNLTSITFPIIDTKTIQNLCHNLKTEARKRSGEGTVRANQRGQNSATFMFSIRQEKIPFSLIVLSKFQASLKHNLYSMKKSVGTQHLRLEYGVKARYWWDICKDRFLWIFFESITKRFTNIS
jgi:hypothetical protein